MRTAKEAQMLHDHRIGSRTPGPRGAERILERKYGPSRGMLLTLRDDIAK